MDSIPAKDNLVVTSSMVARHMGDISIPSTGSEVDEDEDEDEDEGGVVVVVFSAVAFVVETGVGVCAWV